MNWFAENAAALTPLVALVFTAVGVLGMRWWTGARHKEDAESIERAIQLKRLLETEGMTFDDAVILRDRFRSSRGAALQAEARAVIAKEAGDPDAAAKSADFYAEIVPFDETTIGMKLKAEAELQALDAELEMVTADLAHVCSEGRARVLYEAQKAWVAFRAIEADFAALLFEGGTGAPLLGSARMVEMTEQRLADLRLARAEIKNLEGR